jgi:XisH protein
MPRRDTYHDAVSIALQKDGWLITDDPLDLTIGEVTLLADLGAERVIAAERDNEKIAIEIKSFTDQSPVSEFHKALGQYENYRLSLEELEPERVIWLAVPVDAWNDFFQRPFIQKVIKRQRVTILVYDPVNQTIEQWINQ